MKSEQPLCGHQGCTRWGRYVISSAGASSTFPQTHDCCGRHQCKRGLILHEFVASEFNPWCNAVLPGKQKPCGYGVEHPCHQTHQPKKEKTK